MPSTVKTLGQTYLQPVAYLVRELTRLGRLIRAREPHRGIDSFTDNGPFGNRPINWLLVSVKAEPLQQHMRLTAMLRTLILDSAPRAAVAWLEAKRARCCCVRHAYR